MAKSNLSGFVSGGLITGAIAFFVWHELRSPLRRMRESRRTRVVRNLSLAGLFAVASIAAEAPLIQPLARIAERGRWGVLPHLRLPLWCEIPAALVLMDYTFYLWHLMLHRVPFLWRFHAVHHSDLDMDTSTALRFHLGELLLSVPWRAVQVIAIGLTPFTFSVWQLSFGLCVLFHHSNMQVPIRLERALNLILVTPRMHGIHHSVVPEETNSNWSSGLTIWDRLHGTLRLNVPQEQITIGIPALQNPNSVTLAELMKMPFRRQPEYELLQSGQPPSLHPQATDPTCLLP